MTLNLCFSSCKSVTIEQ